MVAVKGRLQNNRFVSEEDIAMPDEAQVIVTFLDTLTTSETMEAKRQKKIFTDFFAGIREDNEELPDEFDKIIAEGLHFSEVDFS
jgi:transcription termination factor NusB